MAATSLHVLISFQITEMFPARSAVFFVRPGFRLFRARFAVHYLTVYSILGSLTATATSTMAV